MAATRPSKQLLSTETAICDVTLPVSLYLAMVSMKGTVQPEHVGLVYTVVGASVPKQTFVCSQPLQLVKYRRHFHDE